MEYHTYNSIKRDGLRLISFIFFNLLVLNSFSQTWEKEIATPESEHFPILASWNNQILLGYTENRFTFVLKFLDSSGDQLMEKRFSPPNNYSNMGFQKLTIVNDTLFTIGTVYNTSETDIVLLKYDLVNDTSIMYVLPTNDTLENFFDYTFTGSSFIIPGRADVGRTIYAAYIKEISLNGKVLNQNYFLDYVFSSGYLWSNDSVYSARTVNHFDFRFNRSDFSPIDTTITSSMIANLGGSITSKYYPDKHYVSGYFRDTSNLSFHMHCEVLKITKDSVLSNNYRFGRDDKANKIQGVQPIGESNSNILFLVGSTADDNVDPRMYPDPTEIALFKTNQNGDTLFMRFYKGEVKYIANSILATPDGGALIASYKYDWNSPYPNQWDIHLLKVDSLGNYTPLSTPDIEKPEVLKVIVYPNPATNQIAFSGVLQFPAVITIYDILGREVKNTILYSNSDKVDISLLNTGTYVFRVNSDNQVARGKFLVE